MKDVKRDKLESALQEFERETSLPARATQEVLSNRGGRYFSTQQFSFNGKLVVLEQMQVMSNGYGYVWKRMRRINDSPSNRLFQLHFKLTDKGNTRYFYDFDSV